jgi:pyrroline-5-carboxylate reductase
LAIGDIAAHGPVVLVGAGNMGGAMLRGWVAAGLSGADIRIVDPNPSPEMLAYCEASGIQIDAAASSDVKAGILFVAVKPQAMAVVLPTLRPLVDAQTVVVSVAAGTTIDTLREGLGAKAIVRAMPNTPAMVGRGITAAVPTHAVDDRQKSAVDALLAVSGPVEWLDDEALIDAVTAVSGSGPAYAFYLVECMAEAGRKAGLPEDLAMRLARATVSGAGELMHRSSDDAGTLRKNVTSPNGTTAAALSVLMEDGAMQALFDRAVAAAKNRSEELSKSE